VQKDAADQLTHKVLTGFKRYERHWKGKVSGLALPPNAGAIKATDAKQLVKVDPEPGRRQEVLSAGLGLRSELPRRRLRSWRAVADQNGQRSDACQPSADEPPTGSDRVRSSSDA